MAERPTIDAVKAAIKTVLSPDVNVDRKPASEWLESFKTSMFAWEICDQLLAAKDSVDISYLAAHMLRQKISNNFNELPPECYTSLKDSLLNHLQIHEDYAVQGQLTSAVADLTLLVRAWQNPIEDLAKQLELHVSLEALPDINHNTLYKAIQNRLIFANIISQMCDLNHHHSERPTRVGAKRREEYEDHLISRCKAVIKWWLDTQKEMEDLRVKLAAQAKASADLEQNMQLKSLEDMANKLIGVIYLCYSAWLRIFDEENVNESLPLIDAAFMKLKDLDCPEFIHKYAVEVVVATANYCEDNRAVDYLVSHIVSQTYTLDGAFMQSIEREEGEKSSNLVKTFTSVAETACKLFVIEKKDYRLIELLLSCMKHYDFEIVEETYSFWWCLLENLQNEVKSSEYGPFVNYVNRFVMEIMKLSRFDPDADTVIEQDQDIISFRSTSADIITNILFLTSVQDFIRDTSILNDLRVNLRDVPWERVEVALYMLSCLVQKLGKDDNMLRLELFQLILQQQTKLPIQELLLSKLDQVPLAIGLGQGDVHPQIVATTLDIIGLLEGFLAEYGDYLAVAVKYIMASISNPEHRKSLILPASKALKNLMELNATRRFSGSPGLLNIVKNLCTNLEDFDRPAAEYLITCCGYFASADIDQKEQFICELLDSLLTQMDKIVATDPTKLRDITKYLDYISKFFQMCSIHPSVLPELKILNNFVDTKLWSAFMRVLELPATEKNKHHIVDHLATALRRMIRCIKPEWMVNKIADTMINLYKIFPQNSGPVYIVSIMVDEFANKSPEINQGLFALLEIFCSMTFTLLNMDASQAKSLLSMKSYPETIDDMMRLFNRFIDKCPAQFVTCKSLESIIELSISSLRLDHAYASATVSAFLCSFIDLARKPDYPHLGEAIRNVLGPRLVDASIRSCLFEVPSGLIKNPAAVLLDVSYIDKDLFARWVRASVAGLPRTNIQGIESVTQEQSDDFAKSIIEAGMLKKLVNCLRAHAHLYS